MRPLRRSPSACLETLQKKKGPRSGRQQPVLFPRRVVEIEQALRKKTGMEMCGDMCIDMCMDMWTDMCVDMCMDMRTDMGVDVCTDACIDMYMDMCIYMCKEVCRHVCGTGGRQGSRVCVYACV